MKQPMNTDPVHYPSLVINGEQVDLKFRQYDIIQLKREEGIDLFTPAEDNRLSADMLERNLKILRHAIAHQVDVSIEDLAKQFDVGDVIEIANALAESIKKVASQITEAGKKVQKQPSA